MADEKARESMFTHEPLPYVVRLRETMGDDTMPVSHEERLVAYSVYEAMMQAIFQAGGHAPSETRFTIESIEPDVPAYYAMLAARVVAAVKGVG